MSDIKAGDLVVIAKPSYCCNNSRNVGKIFTVKALGVPSSDWCSGCLATRPDQRGAQLAEWKGPNAIEGWIEVSRLKRIPPLSELEDEKTKEELTA